MGRRAALTDQHRGAARRSSHEPRMSGQETDRRGPAREHRAQSRPDENMRRNQGGRKQLFSPAQAPDLLPSACTIDEQSPKPGSALPTQRSSAYSVVAVGCKWKGMAYPETDRERRACDPASIGCTSRALTEWRVARHIAMALASVSGALRAGGSVVSFVHPCFPGPGVSGAVARPAILIGVRFELQRCTSGIRPAASANPCRKNWSAYCQVAAPACRRCGWPRCQLS